MVTVERTRTEKVRASERYALSKRTGKDMLLYIGFGVLSRKHPFSCVVNNRNIEKVERGDTQKFGDNNNIMTMVPNNQSSTFSTWVAVVEEHLRGHIYQVCKVENISKTVNWATPLDTTMGSSQQPIINAGLKSIIRPTRFKVVARQDHDADKERLDSTIWDANRDSIESENSGDLVEEAMSRHLDGDGRHTNFPATEFADGDNSIVDTSVSRPRRASSTSGTLRFDPTARILEDDESILSTFSFLSLSPSGSTLENASNWSTSSSVVRSPTSSRARDEGSQLTEFSARNPSTRNPCWTDRGETKIYSRNYWSTRQSPRESVSTYSVSSSVLPSPTDTYDSEESSQSSYSSFVLEESRDPLDQDLLEADIGETRQGIRELSQSIRTPVESEASATGIEVYAASRGDVTTSIICELEKKHTAPRTKMMRPTTPKNNTTSPFRRDANQRRMIEKAESTTPEISKKVAKPPKAVLPPSRGRHPKTTLGLKAKPKSRR
jgi:hypothetical protein